jgi:hypothetical protein
MHVSGGGQGAVQIPDDFLHRPVFIAGDRPQRPAVMLIRRQSHSAEQNRRRYVVRMRDEGHAHPRADGLVLKAHHPGVPAHPEGE